jgi:dipeptidyl aminopeptidase/acylaminoacyl peptidase
LVTTWAVPTAGAAARTTLVAVDTASGERYTLVDDKGADAAAPRVSPDGRWVAYLRETITSPSRAPEVTLAVVELAPKSTSRTLTAKWDRWPSSAAWLPDSSGLLVTADDDGRGPVFHVAATGGGIVPVERVTSDDAAFTDIQVARDGSAFYALRSSYLEPPRPVRIDLGAWIASAPEGSREPVESVALRGPAPAPELPGTLVEVDAAASDDVRVRSWLALPKGAGPESPAPLVLWVHGGPLGSWNAWSWRWNPWLLVAAGYAVLLPDPALSTGYGQDFVQRGWGSWGERPFTDVMAATDAAIAREDVDAERTAMMGGSFGGYMANWIAGHTDRFDAIVTHASLWALDQFGPTTDAGYYWQREMTSEMAEANSPHRSVANIRTPMLVVHGDKDYRVPIGDGLRLWYELLSASGLPADADGSTVHRFLYFPDENHWVLKPQHAIVWYRVVLAFLAEHVLGLAPGDEAWPGLPETLG